MKTSFVVFTRSAPILPAYCILSIVDEDVHIYQGVFGMMTSANGNISVLLAFCAGNSPITGKFPSQRPVARSFDVFFDLRPNACDLRRNRAHYDVILKVTNLFAALA